MIVEVAGRAVSDWVGLSSGVRGGGASGPQLAFSENDGSYVASMK